MKEQTIINIDNANDYGKLTAHLSDLGTKKLLLVCDSSIGFMTINNYFETLRENAGIQVVRFTDFKPNPLYESVVKGVGIFLDEDCDTILAVGGGSAMDVAKCIKLYSNMNHHENYLKQDIVPNEVPFIAVPTTAGTGSEATRYAVIYYEGEKQSVSDFSCIPQTVVMDVSVLETLPEYQKKSTMMDALCHGVESFWSVNSNKESQRFSAQAIGLILENWSGYMANEKIANKNMMLAANIAGKAINITQTTAGHAMCYKLTSLYGIAHGHAAALCVKELWPYMLENTDKCIDARGEDYLIKTFERLAQAFGCSGDSGKPDSEAIRAAAEKFKNLVEKLDLKAPEKIDEKDYNILKNSVNPVRIKNNPVQLTEDSIDMLYHRILT